jgi:hypothetical protein
MESMEDRTIELSALPPFPQSLEIAKERRLPHSHRTTTTDISTLQQHMVYTYLTANRMYLRNIRQWRIGVHVARKVTA